MRLQCHNKYTNSITVTIVYIYFDFKSGDNIKVSCFDWSEEMTKKFRYGDHLRVSINTNELIKWLRDEAFK